MPKLEAASTSEHWVASEHWVITGSLISIRCSAAQTHTGAGTGEAPGRRVPPLGPRRARRQGQARLSASERLGRPCSVACSSPLFQWRAGTRVRVPVFGHPCSGTRVPWLAARILFRGERAPVFGHPCSGTRIPWLAARRGWQLLGHPCPVAGSSPLFQSGGLIRAAVSDVPNRRKARSAWPPARPPYWLVTAGGQAGGPAADAESGSGELAVSS